MKIKQLREENLNLRSQMFFWIQDYKYLEDKYIKLHRSPKQVCAIFSYPRVFSI